MTGRPTVLVVDNFDSFTYNLVEYLSAHADVEVRRNTAALDEVHAVDPDAVVISPGPGHPRNDRDVGVSRAVLSELSPTVPTLGVCLGLQAAVHVHGGAVGQAPEPVHGEATRIGHDGEGVFEGLSNPLRVGRYHSLVATEVPEAFEISAESPEGIVMGLRHEDYPISCVQFHPESVLTPDGRDLMANFVDGV